ncbi:MAG: hypothetical protein H6721_05865 [Sandaracinus sp.]|nr:hypothetical protein [Sandaracinus sp.]
MRSWEREEIVTRREAMSCGWLVVVDGGPPFAVTPGGTRRTLTHVDAILPSPELRWGLDPTRVDGLDLMPIVCLANGESHGLVPRSAATYAWLGDERLLAAWRATPLVTVLDVEGVTLASFDGAHEPRLAHDASGFVFRRRGSAFFVDARTLGATEVGRGDPQLALGGGELVVRDDDGIARVLDTAGRCKATLGRADELTRDRHGRIVGTIPFESGSVVARWREGAWQRLSRGPRDGRPLPSPDSHWIAFERTGEGGPEVWMSSADVEWRVTSGSLLRWQDDDEQLPVHALLDFVRRRERRPGQVFRTRRRPRDGHELEALPRPDDARVAALLATLSDARARLDDALDAPMGHSRVALHQEAARALEGARHELERATRAQLEAHRAHPDEDARAEVEALLAGPEVFWV